uniref:DUF2059 domain-containing protein n=1 Tax=Halomonas sp. TaxID=1486246 RepID=UPI0026037DDE|nr:DUF2059 domain-containing protein [Halomonas sp.]
MKGIIAIVFFLVSCGASAQSRDEMLQQLVEATRLTDILLQKIEIQQKTTQETMRGTVDQIETQINPTPDYMEKFEAAYQDAVSKLAPQWTTQEVASAWGDYYGKNISDEELAQILAFYQSPAGQKDVAATRQAMQELSQHFTEAYKPVVEMAVAQFYAHLQTIADDIDSVN